MCDPSPSVVLTTVFSDELDEAPGNDDGNTVGDISGAAFGTEDLSFELRAERMEGLDGRTYTAAYMATDSKGLSASKTAKSVVPKE